jgi:hypothetical protein
MFTVSPIAVKWRTCAAPMLPTSAGPVLIPTRKRGQSACPAAASSTTVDQCCRKFGRRIPRW